MLGSVAWRRGLRSAAQLPAALTRARTAAPATREAVAVNWAATRAASTVASSTGALAAARRAGLAHTAGVARDGLLLTRPASATALGATRGMVLRINDLADNPGARKPKRRKGRGRGSPWGKTAGRGIKGQKARGQKGLGAGRFEGGQTPLHKRMPKWGFENLKAKKKMQEVNTGSLQLAIDRGLIDTTRLITMRDLKEAGLIDKIKDGVKLLGRPEKVYRDPKLREGKHVKQLRTPIVIEVTRASKNACERVERAGGVVICGWYDRLNLKVLMKPHKFHPLLVPRRARPPGDEMSYYIDPETRGYLSPKMQFKMRELGINLLHIPFPFRDDVPGWEAYCDELARSKKIANVPIPKAPPSPFKLPPPFDDARPVTP